MAQISGVERPARRARRCGHGRAAAADTLIITDGFSCYQQIEGLAGRKALHITEVLQMAIREDAIAENKTKESSPQIYADVHR